MQGNALQMHSFTHSFIHLHFSLQDYRFYVLWGVEGKAGLTTYAKPRLTAMYKYMALHVGMNTAASASLTSARIQSCGLCLPDKKFNSMYSTQYHLSRMVQRSPCNQIASHQFRPLHVHSIWPVYISFFLGEGMRFEDYLMLKKSMQLCST